MKSIKIFAVAGAIGLLGMAGLSSCKQNNSPENGPEGNYNGEVVKTQFSIAFPEAVGQSSGTRYMPGTTVQAGENKASFRGMENINLIPFAYGTIETSTKRGGSNIVLPNSTDNTIGKSDITDEGAKVFTDVSIPLGTKGFLFYAKAIDKSIGGSLSTDEEKHTYGMLTANNLTTAVTPADISFDLVKINQEAKPDLGVKLVMYLNDIIEANDGSATSGHIWKDCALNYPALSSLFDVFKTLSAGSSASIEYTLTEVVKRLRDYNRTNPSTESKALVSSILAAIDAQATIDSDTISVDLDGALEGYPGNLYLPDGAAGLTFNNAAGVDTFEIAGTNANNMMLSGSGYNGLTHYVYPPSLYYYVNSSLLVSNSSQKDNYVNGKTWETIKAGYTNGTEVTLATKSVAITNPIQYGVGRMDLTVSLGTALLKDNDPRGEKTHSITSPIPVKAILIGGQKSVGFNFEPKGSDEFTIYDTTTVGYAAQVSLPHPVNYTLVLETAAATPVTVAIELVNNFGDFYGQGGQLIPNGSKFYLLGTLTPTDGSGVSGSANTGNKVFKQDFKTIVNLSIGATSLKNAYNTIPDLRATNLELGLSVDLHWQEGMTFDITL